MSNHSSTTTATSGSSKSRSGNGGSSSSITLDPQVWIENLGLILAGLLRGLVESMNFAGFLSYMVRSKAIRKSFTECLMLNLSLLMGVLGVGSVLQAIEFNVILTGILEAFFSIAWVLPMSIVTQTLGVTMFFEMYQAAAEQKRIDTKAKERPHRTMNFINLSETLMKTVVTLIFGLTATLISFLPFGIGYGCSMILGAFLHAFYCFDYRFLDQGIIDTKTKRFTPLKLSMVTRFFDSCWPYYLGFGLSHMLIRATLEISLGFGLFAKLAICTVLFPVNVIMTVDAIPGPEIPAVKVPVFTKLLAKTSQALTAWNNKRQSQSQQQQKKTSSQSGQEERNEEAKTETDGTEE